MHFNSSLDPVAAKHPTELQGQWLHRFQGVTLTDPPREGNAHVGLPRSGNSADCHFNTRPTGQSGRVQSAYLIQSIEHQSFRALLN